MLPNLIVIGAMKSGTTSLHYYLNLHPQIVMSKQKEPDFFIEQKNWRNGQAWYESHFTGEAEIHGESSANYTNFPRFSGVPERMYSLVPGVKLIYVIRDPVERIVSHYVHSYANGNENRPFAEAVLTPGEYLNRSKYYMQLEQFLKFYPSSAVLIVAQEDLYGDRVNALKKIFGFLGVDDAFSSPEFSRVLYRSADKRRWGRSIEKPVVDETLRKELTGRLQEDADRIRAFTGCKFQSWCL